MAHFKILACLIFVTVVLSDEVPNHFDWRDKGLVTKVKDQLNCEGSFYFAALDLIASYYYLVYGIVRDLSEQNAIDCSVDVNNGCLGGGVSNTLNFVKSQGIMLEKDYPYTGIQGDCKMNSFYNVFQTIKLETLPENEDIIKTIVATTGPVAVTFKSKDLRSYSGGIYDDTDCQSGQSYSGLIIGYGIEEKRDFWIVKMSYGPNWGEKGYIKLARNTGNRCGIADNAIWLML